MWSKLPNEILEQIFTHPKISKKDLLQLQLTCTQWSPLAQKYFYKNIRMIDYDLYNSKTFDDYPAMKKRFTALIQSLVLVNSQPGKYIETFDLDNLFSNDYNINNSSVHLPLSIAILARLCPNLTSIKGLIKSTEYMNTLSRLHREGFLQRLESIMFPDINNARDMANYHTTILEFKDTLRQLVVVDGISKTISTECLIPPASLQLFTNADHIRLEEFSRVHLYRFKDYISNCGPKVKSLRISMNGAITTRLQVEFNDQHSVQPKENIQQLFISSGCDLSLKELAFIMLMFPSLKSLCLGVLNKFGFDWNDERMMARFFAYLSRISEVDCRLMFSVVSTGLGLLPHLANSIDIRELSIVSCNATERGRLFIDIKRQPQGDKYAACKTEEFRVTIKIYWAYVKESVTTALEKLKGNTIEGITVGDPYDPPNWLLQVDQNSIDCITGQYTSLQNLTFKRVEFPSQVPRSAIKGTQQLSYFHLEECKITENYFTRLSCQFERIDHFKFSSTGWGNSNSAPKKKRVHLPYTAIKTISLDILGVKFCIIKVWANASCITLKASREKTWATDTTLEECVDIESLSNDYDEVIVYCRSLKEICWYEATFQLPCDHNANKRISIE